MEENNEIIEVTETEIKTEEKKSSVANNLDKIDEKELSSGTFISNKRKQITGSLFLRLL